MGPGEQVERPGPPRSAPQPGPSERGMGARPAAGGAQQARRGRAGGLLSAPGSRGLPPARRPPTPRPVPSLVHTAASRRRPAPGGSHCPPRQPLFHVPAPTHLSAAQQPSPSQLLSLPDWLSRDLMPISQSPPLARPRLASERLAAAQGRAQERRAEGVSAPRQGRLPFPVSVRTRGVQ